MSALSLPMSLSMRLAALRGDPAAIAHAHITWQSDRAHDVPVSLAERAAFEVAHTYAHIMSFRFRAARFSAAAAVSIALASDDPAVTAAAYAADALAFWMAGPDNRVSWSAEIDTRFIVASAAVASLPDRELALDRWPAYLLAESAMSGGRLLAAERLAQRGLEVDCVDDGLTPMFRQVRARSLAFQGRLEEAQAEVDTLLAMDLDEVGPIASLAYGVAGYLAALRGDRATLEDAMLETAAFCPDPQRSYLFLGGHVLIAFALTTAGEHAQAAALLLDCAGGPALPHLQAVDRAYGYELLAAGALQSNDLESAREWVDRARDLDTDGMAAAAVARATAMLTSVVGEPGESTAVARRAVDEAARHGGALEAARAMLLLGRSLVASGHREAAIRAFAEAADTATTLGAASIRASAARDLRDLGRRLRPIAGRGWPALSKRERVVAELVAAGHSNRQIASTLHLSERTVQSHVAQILRGLDIGSRASVPRMMAERHRTQQPSAGAVFDGLTLRQTAVARLVGQGNTNASIASVLGVSVKTIEKHLGDIFTRWNVNSRTAVAARAIAFDGR
jgi:DNA-binding NarL/FixJ family response regulator